MSDAIQKKLDMIVMGRQNLAITNWKLFPPCFESAEQYEKWIDASDPETGAKPPPRTDWPGEPNYCRDCDPEYHKEMRKQDRCLFPDTRFVLSGDGDDEELIGIS